MGIWVGWHLKKSSKRFEARTVVFSDTFLKNEGFYSPLYIYKLILESGLYMIHIRRSNLDVRFFLILEMKRRNARRL